MATGVDELLNMLFEMVDEAKNAPFTSDKCVLERDRVLDLIDDIRNQLPPELEAARKLTETRTEFLASAKREAEMMRKQAENEAQHLVANDTIMLQVKQKTTEMVHTAEERNRELKMMANKYCEDALQRTEDAVASAYQEIRESRANFRMVANSQNTNTAPSNASLVYDAEADED